jgi:hypothetical protein
MRELFEDDKWKNSKVAISSKTDEPGYNFYKILNNLFFE